MHFTSPSKLLGYLNSTYVKLHRTFEDAFWVSYMGDHRFDRAMTKSQERRDAFRGDVNLKSAVEEQLKNAKGESKERLIFWNNFFSLYQIPEKAVPLKKKAMKLEAQVLKKRAKRKEGYLDPKTKKFTPASENRLRILMRTHEDEAVRKACFESLEKLALDCVDDFVAQVKIRNAFAQALGYKDFYEYKIHIDKGMSKKELFSIFEEVYKKTKYAFGNVRKLEKTYPGLRKPWNFGFLLAGDFVKEEDQYLQFGNGLSYWGKSFHAMGIGFRGGSLNLDLIDRKGKYNNGFCHYPGLVHFKNGKRIPGVCNFTSNAVLGQVGAGSQAIHTLFHEAGHAADRLNSEQEDTCLNTEYPPASVSWSETHSMFLDAVASSVEWRHRYARNARGEPYPFALFEKKLRKMYPLIPLDLMSIMFVVFFEKEIYECKNLTKDFVIKTAKKMYRKYFDRSVDSISILNVPHIYSWESSAYYHGYGLAELAVHQWREYFYKKYGYIVDNPQVGKEMRKVWQLGSRYTTKEFVEMATGKPPRADAYVRNVTKTLSEMLITAQKRIKRLKKVPQPKGPVKLDAQISLFHGKKKIADNSKGFEDMDKKYRAWLMTLS